jgi:hypothetical protein
MLFGTSGGTVGGPRADDMLGIFSFALFCSHKKGRKKVRPKMTTAIFGGALIELLYYCSEER